MNSLPAVNGAASFQPRKHSGSHRGNFDGILLVDKPEGITSYGVVDKVKRILHVKKVGHCGTLDPFATGVLIICVGQATRIVDQLLTQDKVYAFTAVMGSETDTQDKTGSVVASWPTCHVSRQEIEAALQEFTGHVEQKVPRFSAVKIAGKRLYQLTRDGVDVDPPTRAVEIKRLRLVRYDWPEVEIEVACSKGTYVRQLATDMGRKLGCGAHVAELRRLASGSFTLDRAISLERLMELGEQNRLHEAFISMGEALAHLPEVVIEDRETQERLANGQLSRQWQEAHRQRFHGEREPVCLKDGHGSLLALWWPHSGGKSHRRLRTFQYG